ncbi:MAG: DUF3307 domain-containing protein [Solirubrobacterales bacterium]|nr:DUF3307 domain-containing protein [Solirubrobacterales bacterium]
MDWSDLFIVLVVSHLGGDFILQTQWQAVKKVGGLGPDAECRRALLSHLSTYVLAYVPALVWIGAETGVLGVLAVVLTTFLPHYLQDDGRLLLAYVKNVKKVEPPFGSPLWIAIDQSVHIVALLGTALLIGLAL